jgi:hypothetical protein
MTSGYHDVAPGPPPLRIDLQGAALAVFTLVTAA